MALIQSGDSNHLLSVNPSGQALVSTSLRTRLGVYTGHSGVLNALATAHTAAAGFLWLLNPGGSPRTVAVRRLELTTNSVGVANTVTRVTVERMSATGSPNGSPIAAARVSQTDPTPSAFFATNAAGLTITPGPVVYGFQMLAVLTAAGTAVPVSQEFLPREEAMPILQPGEGLVVRQPDPGVASDPRRLIFNIGWEEF